MEYPGLLHINTLSRIRKVYLSAPPLIKNNQSSYFIVIAVLMLASFIRLITKPVYKQHTGQLDTLDTLNTVI